MMENIGEVLKASGLTFDVFKCTAMLADMSDGVISTRFM